MAPARTPASATLADVPLPFRIGAVGTAILALGHLVFLTLALVQGMPAMAAVFTVFTGLGMVVLQASFAVGAAFPSRLGDGVRTAFLVASALVGAGGVGMLSALLFGFPYR